MAAMSDDYTETASFLIEKGAKIDSKTLYEETPPQYLANVSTGHENYQRIPINPK